MSIAIITVCHRSSPKMGAYVASFLERHPGPQARSTISFVFVENSGDPGLPEAVQPLKAAGFSVTVLDSENEGFGRGCNLGAAQTDATTLIFANPDIRFLSSVLPLEEPPRLQWGTGRQITPKGLDYSIDLFPEGKGLLYSLFSQHKRINRHPDRYIDKCFVVGAFLIVSNDLFKRSGGFDPRFFLYYEEAELARRLRQLVGPPTLRNDIEVFHEGLGSHPPGDGVFAHELQGFLTYCEVTGQPELVARRLFVLRCFSPVSRPARKIRDLLLQQRPELR